MNDQSVTARYLMEASEVSLFYRGDLTSGTVTLEIIAKDNK